MQKLRIAMFALLLPLLIACGGAQSATPTSAPAPTAQSAATSAPAATAVIDSTSAPAATSAPESTFSAGGETSAPGGLRTFEIVPEQSEASYEVQELFLRQNLPFRAIGRTNAITGTFRFTQDGQPSGEITSMVVDLRTLTTDSPRRDQAIRREWLESDVYPYAEFVSTGVEGVPASYAEGEQISFKLNGDMTIRDVTKPVTFDVTGTLEGDTVTGTATTIVFMRDFGFEPPVIAGVLTVEDGVTVNVNFTAKEVTQ